MGARRGAESQHGYDWRYAMTEMTSVGNVMVALAHSIVCGRVEMWSARMEEDALLNCEKGQPVQRAGRRVAGRDGWLLAHPSMRPVKERNHRGMEER